MLLVGVGLDADVFFAHFEVWLYGLLIVSPILVSVGQQMVGPSSVIVAVLYVEVPVFAVYLLPPAMTALVEALIAVEFGIVVFQRGYPSPGIVWSFLVGSVVLIGVVFGTLINRAVGEAERHARLRRSSGPGGTAAPIPQLAGRDSGATFTVEERGDQP